MSEKILKSIKFPGLNDTYVFPEVPDVDDTLSVSGEAADAKAVGDALAGIGLKAYPVNSIYMSVNSTSPASLFGGTWTQLKDRFLLGAGSTYSNGATGGAATVTLTTAQMPAHTHDSSTYLVNAVGGLGNSIKTAEGNYYDTAYGRAYATTSTGGGSAHNNMPPYLVVYMWKRTA